MTGDSGSVRVGDCFELGVSPKAVQDFYSAHWSRPLAFQDRSFYDWQFIAPPENGNADRCCVAVGPNGDVLGIMGLNRRPFILNGETVNAAELTTWVVSPDAAALGIGGRIMRYLQATYDLLTGMGITDAALSVYLRSGFRYVKAIPRMTRVYDPDAFGEMIDLDQIGKRLVHQFAKKTSPFPDSAEAVSCPAATLGDLASVTTTRCNGFRRSSVDLEWRYDRHPIFEYQAFRVTDNAGSGLECGVVLREDKILGRPFVHVLDVLGSDEAVGLATGFIDRHCNDIGAAGADFFCTASATVARFRAGCWFSGNDDKYVRLVHLFHPPELRDPATTSLVMWTRKDMAALLDIGRLYVTKQDMDFDRPTLHYIQSNH